MVTPKYFTLMEVVIAIAILASTVLSVLTLSGEALKQTVSAVQNWKETHRVVQAAEYFLTVGPDGGGISGEIFPYDDCNAYLRLDHPTDPPDLTYIQEMDAPARELRTLSVEVNWPETGRRITLNIDKLIYIGKDEK